MKKILFIGLIVALLLILVGGAGVVFARVRNLDNAANITLNTNLDGDEVVTPFGPGRGGMMNGYRNNPGGMMGGIGPGGMMGRNGVGGMMGGRRQGFNRGTGLMHDYMISAFADAVGLTPADVNTRLSNGETLIQIANAQGFTGDKLTELVSQVRKAALDKAVADGVITQAQADSMLERMNNLSGQDFGLDNCPMWDNDKVQP